MFSRPDLNPPVPDEPLAVARAAVFSPIAGEGLVEAAVRRLGEAIGLGLLEVGDRLPSEIELAERFDIAPMTLRQALAILRQAGYVETRRGRGGGTFVCRAVPPPPVRKARERLRRLTVDDLRDLTDFRVIVAGASAALASERSSQFELESLRLLVETMAGALAYQAFRRADSRFPANAASLRAGHREIPAGMPAAGSTTWFTLGHWLI